MDEPTYPAAITEVNHVEAAPRRVRATLAGETVFDTCRALYVWEHRFYPQYYVPADDVNVELLEAEEDTKRNEQGTLAASSIVVGGMRSPTGAWLVTEPAVEHLNMTYRFEWGALDRWFEEDQEVFVHPRSPYVRTDAVRSTRRVRVELEGEVLAASSSPVMLFETGLPTRYYVEKTDVRWQHLTPTDTLTQCPYKGTTTGYWDVDVGGERQADLAWSYDFPVADVIAIAGRVAFYNEKVDIFIDDERLERPITHFG